MQIIHKLSVDKKLLLLVFGITLTVFIFTTDAHRYTIDEDITQQLTQKLVTQIPDPLYVQGQSRMEFNYPNMAPWIQGPLCQNAILCYPAQIGQSLTEIPFFAINHYLHIIKSDTLVLSSQDFDDPHYVYWRNSIDPDFTFLELFYGPFISALSVSVFFLICRSFDYSPKNSVMLSFIFGLSTTVWAYSKTSLNGVPEVLFILLGFLLFKKFQKNGSIINVILCAASIGFAFLCRQDAYFFIMMLLPFFLFEVRKQNKRILKITSFFFTLSLSYMIYVWVDRLRWGISSQAGSGSNAISQVAGSLTPASNITAPVFGLLLSPGVGLLIFAPILFTIFFSFQDLYTKNKKDFIFFLGYIVIILLVYPNTTQAWQGFVAWGARYLLPVIPFMLLPLGASLEKRKSKSFYLMLIVLGGIGVFINMIYMVQDVSWFVWTYPGSHSGLFGLAKPSDPLYLSPAVTWSLRYSQLTQSAITAFTHLQTDIFLLKLMGPIFFVSSFVSVILPLIYLLVRVLKEKHGNKLVQ